MDNLFKLDSKFMQGMNKFADLMYLDILTLICCIPIITIGPALTAMHYVLLKMYRNEGAPITKSFFKSFKENFKQSTVLGLIYVVIAAVLFIDFVYIRQMEDVSLFIEIVVIVAIVLYAFSYVWLFPLQCRYENPIKTTIKNSFMVGALNFPKSFMMILISFAPILIQSITNALTPAVIMLGLSVPAYVQTMLYSRVFDKMEGIERTADGEIIEDNWTLSDEDEEFAKYGELPTNVADVIAAMEKEQENTQTDADANAETAAEEATVEDKNEQAE